MPRILIADDHGLFRKGLRATLEAALPDLQIYEADCLDMALMAIEADNCIDLVIIDLYMPGVLSFDSLRAARECYANLRFMVISASDAREDVLACLGAGFQGFASKLQPDNEIVGAVEQVLKGAIYVPPWLAQARLFESGHPGLQTHLKAQDSLARLTPRQRDVLPLLARGLSNKEIARALKIAEATTKIHAAALRRVLGARNRTEAAVVARQLLQSNGQSHPSRRA